MERKGASLIDVKALGSKIKKVTMAPVDPCSLQRRKSLPLIALSSFLNFRVPCVKCTNWEPFNTCSFDSSSILTAAKLLRVHARQIPDNPASDSTQSRKHWGTSAKPAHMIGLSHIT